MIKELETRFSNDHGLVAVQYLVPSCLSQLSQDKVESIEHFYGKFLTYEKETLATELIK